MAKKTKLRILGAIAADFARNLPERIACSDCDSDLFIITKDPVARRLAVQVRFRRPVSTVDQPPGLGLVTCDRCGAQTQVDLRLFGLARPRAH